MKHDDSKWLLLAGLGAFVLNLAFYAALAAIILVSLNIAGVI